MRASCAAPAQTSESFSEGQISFYPAVRKPNYRNNSEREKRKPPERLLAIQTLSARRPKPSRPCILPTLLPRVSRVPHTPGTTGTPGPSYEAKRRLRHLLPHSYFETSSNLKCHYNATAMPEMPEYDCERFALKRNSSMRSKIRL